MKNLTKIFMAVVAGMFAFSCVTDTTEDLGVNIQGNWGGAAEVTLSLEAARTQLGEKADGVYPLYWSEGDAIAINGTASNPLVEAGNAAATFQFNEAVAYPHCVVYPAPAVAAVEEAAEPTTVYPVNFLATQPYTAGTFAQGAAPMYGYGVAPADGEAAPAIEMQHLSGVLRFAVVGNGETLKTLNIKSLSSKISGAFTVDCTNGTLVADENASNTITVTFPEGTVLGEEPLVVYVAVPAGKHGEIWATLRTAEDKMTVKFNSDVKPLVAGNIREFKQFTYQANEGDTDASVFEIDSKETLIEFARIASVFAPRTTAKVVANIDMSGYDWKPIEGFGAYTFDGGKEDGFSINGLNAPLFGSTAATIQNLNLTGVNITTDRTQAGAVACQLYGPAMTNVSASGALVVNNTTFTTTASMEAFDVINYGGLVGIAGGVAFENCENRVNITVQSIVDLAWAVAAVEAKSAAVPRGTIGGAIGAAHSKSSFTNIDNYGTITIAKSVYSNYTYVGGVLGTMVNKNAPAVVTFTGCDNHGKISTDVSDGVAAEGATQITLGYLKVGGITSNLLAGTDFNNNHNHAAIHHKGWAGETGLAGIVGQQNYSAVVNCTNNAPITNSGRMSFLQIGGIVGDDVLAAITNCTNNAEGDILHEAGLDLGVGASSNVYLGGIVAGNESGQETIADLDPAANAISGCYNKGDITLSGYVNSVFLGGINARECGVNIVNCHNEGNIKHIGVHVGNFYISGITGLNATSIVNSTNSGDITISGTAEKPLSLNNYCSISGIGGTVSGVLKNCSNSGNITVDYVNQISSNKNLNVFGCVVTANCSTEKIYNCDNSGNISVGENGAVSTKGNVQIAGCLGAVANYLVEGCDNTGNITLGPNSPLRPTYVAGVVFTASRGVYDCTNKGKITVNGNSENTETAVNYYIGGVVDLAYDYMAECENLAGGDITVKNCPKMTMQLGGVARYVYATTRSSKTEKWSNNKNHAKIDISDVGGWANDTHFRIGGLTACTNTSGTLTADNQVVLHNSSNNGNITINNLLPGLSASGVFYRLIVGGCIATGTTGPFVLDNVDNNGTITVNTYGKDNAFVGGVIGYWSMAAGTADVYIKNCDNTKDITVTTTKPSTGAATGNKGEGILMGGIFAGNYKNTATGYDIEVSDCTNSGNVTLQGNYFSSGSSRYQLGGIIGDGYAYGAYTRCYNSGTITLDGGNQTLVTVEIAGLMARHGPHKDQSYKYGTYTDCVNQGKVVAKNMTVNNAFYVAGVIGNDAHQTNKVATYNNCANSGDIYIEKVAVNSGKAFYVGGLTARGDAKSVVYSGTNVNIGNIILKDCTCPDATTLIGGIVGYTRGTSVTNAKAYCGIMATDCTNVGWIMGTNRDTARLASGCGIGGKIITNMTEETIFDGNGDPDGVTIVYDGSAIDASNYLSKVYGGKTAAESDAEASLLTEAPTVTAPVAPAN
ncbi:MAG: hypothetical protein IIV16_02505 [Alistipes sp.]|nr:hypothetical protein [Alistipes sp.]